MSFMPNLPAIFEKYCSSGRKHFETYTCCLIPAARTRSGCTSAHYTNRFDVATLE